MEDIYIEFIAYIVHLCYFQGFGAKVELISRPDEKMSLQFILNIATLR